MPPTHEPTTWRDDWTEEMLRRVSPRDAQGYARSRGWTQQQRIGHLMVFNRPEQGSLDQVLVPTDAAQPDFADRVLDVLERLAQFEERATGRILVDLLNFDADIMRFRVASQRAERGTLPLNQVIDLLDGAKRSLLSAAHSALVLRRHHPKLSRTDAVQLLDACQMGQTERGSFVVTISCPLHAVDADEAGLGGGGRPFARQATTLLAKALGNLNTAIEEDRINSLVSTDSPLVSANLCEALLKMRPLDDTGVLEFIPSWAASTPIEEDESLFRRVAFSADEFSSIEDVYRQLRPVKDPTAKAWIAIVDELRGTEGDGGTREGEVLLTLFDDDDGSTVRAKVSLNTEQYEIAYRAHNPSQVLVVFGELSRGLRVSRLSNVKTIRFARLEDIQGSEKV